MNANTLTTAPEGAKTKTYSVPTADYADPETRAKHLVSLIIKNAPTAKKVALNVMGEEIVINTERVLNPTEKTQSYLTDNVSAEEYRIQRELIQNASAKSVKAGHCPYVYDATADGKVEYTIPLGVPKWSAGEVKSLKHNHERKWSVQARLRAKVLANGGTLTNNGTH
jgi:hypothetical protein